MRPILLLLAVAVGASAPTAAEKGKQTTARPVQKVKLVGKESPSVRSKDRSKALAPIGVELVQQGEQVVLRLTRDAEVQVWARGRLEKECAMGRSCDVTDAVKRAGEEGIRLLCKDRQGRTHEKKVPTAASAHRLGSIERRRLEGQPGKSHPGVRKPEAARERRAVVPRDVVVDVQPEIPRVEVRGSAEGRAPPGGPVAHDETPRVPALERAAMGSELIGSADVAPAESDMAPAEWKVRGRVTDLADEPLEGLTITAYDADMLMDDLLGSASTDAAGDFGIVYRGADFDELAEAAPDLYVEIRAPGGRVLHSSRASVRYEASQDEVFEVRIHRPRSSAGKDVPPEASRPVESAHPSAAAGGVAILGVADAGSDTRRERCPGVDVTDSTIEAAPATEGTSESYTISWRASPPAPDCETWTVALYCGPVGESLPEDWFLVGSDSGNAPSYDPSTHRFSLQWSRPDAFASGCSLSVRVSAGQGLGPP